MMVRAVMYTASSSWHQDDFVGMHVAPRCLSGKVTTLAGDGRAGVKDGRAVVSQLIDPKDIAVHANTRTVLALWVFHFAVCVCVCVCVLPKPV
jgi:hypothetical protein